METSARIRCSHRTLQRLRRSLLDERTRAGGGAICGWQSTTTTGWCGCHWLVLCESFVVEPPLTSSRLRFYNHFSAFFRIKSRVEKSKLLLSLLFFVLFSTRTPQPEDSFAIFSCFAPLSASRTSISKCAAACSPRPFIEERASQALHCALRASHACRILL